MSATAKHVSRGNSRFYPIDGVMLPSVTSITSLLAKPALVNWAGKVNRLAVIEEAMRLSDEAIDPYSLARLLREKCEKRIYHNEQARDAANLGTLAHARCEWLVQKMLGRPVGPDPVSLARAAIEERRKMPAFHIVDGLAEKVAAEEKRIDMALWASMSFEDWAKEVDFRPAEAELVVWSKRYGYAGTLDILGRVNGWLAVVDLKTSSGLWPEMKMQVAAYGRAYFERDHNLSAYYLLRLPKKESDPGFEAVEIEDVQSHFKAFLSLLDVWRWNEEVTK